MLIVTYNCSAEQNIVSVFSSYKAEIANAISSFISLKINILEIELFDTLLLYDHFKTIV